ncbi:MAG: hypothetical protein QNJ51_07960 [Calothrix sp. MO_167.B12]|nr:hypothetical protein [Calothrix sp. MO_167.B12]
MNRPIIGVEKPPHAHQTSNLVISGKGRFFQRLPDFYTFRPNPAIHPQLIEGWGWIAELVNSF